MDPLKTEESALSAIEVVAPSTSGESENKASHQHERQAENQETPFYQSERTEFSCKKLITKRLPILRWLPKYKRTDLFPDAISGVTVGLTYGLYSSFISCFVYLFLGSCRQMTIGPTALMELLVFEKCGQNFPSCVILVGFYVGIIQFVMGLLRLGAVVSLISDPVTIGFVGGAALTISSSQIRSFFGLSGPKGNGFVGYCKAAIENIGSAKWGDTVLGFSCVLLLVLFKNLKDYVKFSETTRSGRVANKLLWVLNISRNALVVIAASAVAAILQDPPFALTGSVKSGFPPVRPPTFELPTFPTHTHDDDSNGTSSRLGFFDRMYVLEDSTTLSNGTMTFWETLGELRQAPLMIAIISILQNVAIAKAFGSGQSIDATQEMIALGVSHVIASFFSSIPTAGSFTRSAVNEASGVKSPVSGIFTGLLVLFALSFLTRWFAYIPKATLAAVILCAVLPMIEYETIVPMWKVSKLDVLTVAITFFASLLLGMEYGILIGVAASLGLYLMRPVQPRVAWSLVNMNEHISLIDKQRVSEQESSGLDNDSGTFLSSPMLTTYHLLKPEQGFSFPSVDAMRTMINKLALKYPDVRIIALDCQSMITMDYTSASALCSLVKALKKTDKALIFIHCKSEWVQMMQTVGLKEPECYGSVEDLRRHLCENK